MVVYLVSGGINVDLDVIHNGIGKTVREIYLIA